MQHFNSSVNQVNSQKNWDLCNLTVDKGLKQHCKHKMKLCLKPKAKNCQIWSLHILLCQKQTCLGLWNLLHIKRTKLYLQNSYAVQNQVKKLDTQATPIFLWVSWMEVNWICRDFKWWRIDQELNRRKPERI